MAREGHRVLGVMKTRILSLIGTLGCFLTGCASLPEGIEPVQDFDLDAYLGKWYEIARLDHRFERGLEEVTAEYSLQADGSIKVVNRAYSPKIKGWKDIEGKAYPARGGDEGFLKVSFFGPFYGGYCVFELDPKGQYAFVAGSNRSYLWLLARTPAVGDEVWRKFEAKAKALGFDLSELVRVRHSK